jgi:hypothetical protein
MKKIRSIIITGVLIFSGFGASAITIQIQSSNLDKFDMVIITPQNFSNALQQLINHKNNIGVQTFLKTTEEIYSQYQGRDNAEQIKYFIKDAIEQSNISYVLLIGGKELLPVRYLEIYESPFAKKINFINMMKFDLFKSVIYQTTSFISDLYYADIYDKNMNFCTWDSNNNDIFGEMNHTTIIDDVDLYPDVYIGRLLCSSIKDVESVISKIINYESTKERKDWFNNLIVIGGDTHISIFQEIMLRFLFKKGRIAFEGEYMCEKASKYLYNFNAHKIYTSSFFGIRADRLSVENINAAINSGAGLLLIALHGSPTMLATHPPFSYKWVPPSFYKISDVQDLQNGEKLPVLIMPACNCANFENESSPITWEFVGHENGGSIASFGFTTYGMYLPSTLAIESLGGYLAMSIFEDYAKGIDIVGELWCESIKKYLDDEEALSIGNLNHSRPYIKIDNSEPWFNNVAIEEWILFGDPSLKIGGYSN